MTNRTPDQPTRTVRLTPSRPPRRGRRTAWIVGGAVVALSAGTLAAVASGVSTANGLRHETTTRSFAAVREIVVDLDEGRIGLRSAPGPGVVVRTTETWGDGDRPVVAATVTDGGVLTVTADCPEFDLGCETAQDIEVLAGTPVRARAVDGAIDAGGLDVPRFAATTVGGSVTAGFVRAPDDVAVDTVAGAVRVIVPAGLPDQRGHGRRRGVRRDRPGPGRAPRDRGDDGGRRGGDPAGLTPRPAPVDRLPPGPIRPGDTSRGNCPHMQQSRCDATRDSRLDPVGVGTPALPGVSGTQRVISTTT
ncbi:MAG: hypothetical protein OJJ54_11055 [Pseudonocardia sp.]|nr:hypothetical protein [Pseudonocardia sp.]